MLRTFVGHEQPVVALAYGDGMLYSSAWDNTIRAWNVKVRPIIFRMDGHS